VGVVEAKRPARERRGDWDTVFTGSLQNRTGIKKGHLVEQALLHHLQALDELPAEFIIHPRIVVSRKAGEKLLREAESAEPTPALRQLMRDGD